MPPATTFDEPAELDVGDRVIATEPVGPAGHRRIPRGVVVARTAKRLIAVRFDSGPVERLHSMDCVTTMPTTDCGRSRSRAGSCYGRQQ